MTKKENRGEEAGGGRGTLTLLEEPENLQTDGTRSLGMGRSQSFLAEIAFSKELPSCHT